MSGSDDDAGEFTLLPTRLNQPWLLDRLRCVQGHKPMMTSALAGSGQSTLLCQWLDSCPHPSVWLSRDAGDNDLAAFVSRLIATIQTVFPTPQARRSASLEHPIRRWRQSTSHAPPGAICWIPRIGVTPTTTGNPQQCIPPFPGSNGHFRVQKMTDLLLHHDDAERPGVPNEHSRWPRSAAGRSSA